MDTNLRDLQRKYEADKDEQTGKALLAATLRSMDLSAVIERILTSLLGRVPTTEETLHIIIGQDAKLTAHVAIVNGLIYHLPETIDSIEKLEEYLDFRLALDDTVVFTRIIRTPSFTESVVAIRHPVPRSI